MIKKNIKAIAPRSKPTEPGVPFVLAGETLLVPSLTFSEFQRLYPILTSDYDPARETLVERVGGMVSVIGSAIRVNYPEIDDEYIRERLRLSQISTLMNIIKGQSGMREVEPGE